MNPQSADSRLRLQEFLKPFVLGLSLLVVPAILSGKDLPAPARATQSAQQQRAAKPARLRRRAAAHAQSASTRRDPAPEAIAAPPPVSPAPILPANQPPHQARVRWDSRGLEIEAFNSSLNQILHQIAADTGARLECRIPDQRIFGSYGPGPASDVLLKLLDGSGYNLLMTGGRDADPPLEIVLSTRSPAGPQTAANNPSPGNSQADEDPDPNGDPTEQPRPEVQNPYLNGAPPPHDPAQFMQEILDRQHKIDLQAQQQQDQQQDQRNDAEQ
jgi:hypothetical protein